ncbi:MAG: MoaD/ThiS family protein [Cyclobacteriaceae bacterium]|nr:MoaD/ThiS family protein [Cyclobacteriaceae bacterium]
MVKVKLFGIAKDIVSASYFEAESGVTVNHLKQNMIAQYPAFSNLRSVLVAVNDEYALDDVVIYENDDVAIIPPVSGG